MMTFMKISMKKKYQLAVILALLVSLLMSNARAEMLFVREKSPIKLQMVAEHINHVSFAKKLVRSIWGDDSEFSAALSSNGQDLFLLAKKPVGSTLQLTVELMNGKMLDLLLEITSGERGAIIALEYEDLGE
jgi:hypothetical protein